MSSIIIRKLTEADVDAVAELERANFSHPWKEGDFADLVDKPDRGCVVATDGDSIIGCVVYRNIVGDVDITNVQVARERRRQGIARALLEQAITEARAIGGQRFTLEVRASNVPAISLYESLGFTREGLRRNFYQNPVEDAVIMWLY